MVILVAEDDPAVRALLSRVLARRGWDVLWACGGRELLSLWESERPRMILSDIDFGAPPDGIEACAEIRGRDPGARIRLMSGDPGNAPRAASAGFPGVLGKPFSLAALDQSLDELSRGVSSA